MWPRDGSSAKFCGGGHNQGQCGRSRRPGKRLEYAKRLEQVERLKAEERMKNPTQNFAEGEAGITPRMREKLPFVAYGNVSGSDHPHACGKNPRFSKLKTCRRGSPPRMREKLDDGNVATVSPGDHPAHAGTDIRENFPGSELVPFPE